ncbi:MAG: ABC transporter ATP-binding protein [Flavobacteriales bacterium]|nr:ABC transporter ATP-binding protein [Flavobacteriales bacterium]
MRSLKHLNKYLYKYRYRLLLGFLFIIASNAFAIWPAQLIREAFDLMKLKLDYVAQHKDKNLFEETKSQIIIFAALIIGAALLKGLFMFLMRQALIIMSRNIEFDLKNEIYSQYQKMDSAFISSNRTGDMINRISEDVSRVRMYVGPAIMYTLNLAVLFILLITTMLSVNVKLTLYVLAPLPVLSISIYYVSSIMNKQSERVQEQLSTLSIFVQESFSGIRVIKSYLKEDYTIHKLDKECTTYKERSLKLIKVEAIFLPAMLLLIGLSTLITIYIGGKEAIAGNISTGNIVEFVIYVNMLTWPVASLGWVTSLVQRASASQKRINEFLDVNPEVYNTALTETLIKGTVEFNNVSFTYKNANQPVLRNISFTVKKGESLAIIGKTGSGKSTIAHLITRMADIMNGDILIDNTSIRETNLNSLRKSIGYVPQDSFLFSDTIHANISYGSSKLLSEEEVIKSSTLADIHDNIMELPDRYKTFIGERGVTLSGGQKQRICIARALINNPKILILDDCLSAVDSKTESTILHNLKSVIKDTTTIMISHRVSAVKDFNQIIVIDEGKIIETGNHDELMQLKDQYFDLYMKQQKEEKAIN